MAEQVIFGTDTAKGRGVIAATNVDSEIINTVTKWNSNVTSETRSFLIPSAGTDVSEKVFTLVNHDGKTYLLYTVYSNLRDRAGRWNTETHAVIMDSKCLDAPEDFLYFDKNQLDPYNAKLAEPLNIKSETKVCIEEAMKLCGFQGKDDQKYRKLMKCVYSILTESTPESQVLKIKIKSEEQIFPCLQVIYYGMPKVLRYIISASNVPMVSVALSFVTDEYEKYAPWPNYFDLETGASYIPEYDINLLFFGKYMEDRDNTEKIIDNIEKAMKEVWDDEIEKHFNFLSYYLLALEKKNNPSFFSAMELEKMLSSLLMTKNSCEEIENLALFYVTDCINKKYVVRSSRLKSILNVKYRRLKSINRDSAANLANMIRYYTLWMNLNYDPEKVKTDLAEQYINEQDRELFFKDYSLAMRILKTPEKQLEFTDDFLSNALAVSFGKFDKFNSVKEYIDMCNKLAVNRTAGISDMKKTNAFIKNTCLGMFDERYFKEPTRLKGYFVDYINKLKTESGIPDGMYQNIKQTVRANFWRSLDKSQYSMWMESDQTIASLQKMAGEEDEEYRSIFKNISSVYESINNLGKNEGYNSALKKELKAYESYPELTKAICEVVLKRALNRDSDYYNITIEKTPLSKACMYNELFKTMSEYIELPENIFDLTKDLNIDFIGSFTENHYYQMGITALAFYVNQLEIKKQSCTGDELKKYESSYAVASKVYAKRQKSEGKAKNPNDGESNDKSLKSKLFGGLSKFFN